MAEVRPNEKTTQIPLKELLFQTAGLSDYEPLPPHHEKRRLIDEILSHLFIHVSIFRPPLQEKEIKGARLSRRTAHTAVFEISRRQAERHNSPFKEGEFVNIQNYYCQWKRMRLFHGDQYVIEDEEGHYFPLEICFVCISHTNPKRLGCPGADTEW